MLEGVRLSSVSKVNWLKAKNEGTENPLPQATTTGLQKDVFQKQNKLNSICALTDGYATPMML